MKFLTFREYLNESSENTLKETTFSQEQDYGTFCIDAVDLVFAQELLREQGVSFEQTDGEITLGSEDLELQVQLWEDENIRFWFKDVLIEFYNHTKGTVNLLNEDEIENPKTFKEIKGMLQKGWVEVHFIKKNGDKRIMVCTTKTSEVPAKFQPKGTGYQIKPDSPVIRVFEKDNGWRSFNQNSVTKYKQL